MIKKQLLEDPNPSDQKGQNIEDENPRALNYCDLKNLYICLNKAIIMFKKLNKL